MLVLKNVFNICLVFFLEKGGGAVVCEGSQSLKDNEEMTHNVKRSQTGDQPDIVSQHTNGEGRG